MLKLMLAGFIALGIAAGGTAQADTKAPPAAVTAPTAQARHGHKKPKKHKAPKKHKKHPRRAAGPRA